MTRPKKTWRRRGAHDPQWSEDARARFVYFVRAADSDAVKIGSAFDVDARIEALQVSHHETLVLVRVVRGGEREEKALHLKFAKHRIRGEWFALSAIVDEIAALPDELKSERRLVVRQDLPMRHRFRRMDVLVEEGSEK